MMDFSVARLVRLTLLPSIQNSLPAPTLPVMSACRSSVTRMCRRSGSSFAELTSPTSMS